MNVTKISKEKSNQIKLRASVQSKNWQINKLITLKLKKKKEKRKKEGAGEKRKNPLEIKSIQILLCVLFSP